MQGSVGREGEEGRMGWKKARGCFGREESQDGRETRVLERDAMVSSIHCSRVGRRGYLVCQVGEEGRAVWVGEVWGQQCAV